MTKESRVISFTAEVRANIDRVVSGKNNRLQVEQLMNTIDQLHLEEIKQIHQRRWWERLFNV